MNNYGNDSDDNINFSDNYDDDGFFNNKSEKSKTIESKKDQVSKKVISVKKSSNEIDESINDAYDDDDWGEKSNDKSASKNELDEPMAKAPTPIIQQKP